MTCLWAWFKPTSVKLHQTGTFEGGIIDWATAPQQITRLSSVCLSRKSDTFLVPQYFRLDWPTAIPISQSICRLKVTTPSIACSLAIKLNIPCYEINSMLINSRAPNFNLSPLDIQPFERLMGLEPRPTIYRRPINLPQQKKASRWLGANFSVSFGLHE